MTQFDLDFNRIALTAVLRLLGIVVRTERPIKSLLP